MVQDKFIVISLLLQILESRGLIKGNKNIYQTIWKILRYEVIKAQ